MTNRYLLALVAGFVSAPALGADLYPAKSAPVPFVSPVYNWTGFYLGAHGGYGFDGHTQDIANPSASRHKLEGGFGGIQGGYNWQGAASPYVLGIEADVSFGDISNNWGGANQFDPYFGKDSIKTSGTVRGRVGYAFDRVLVYGTGGFAWAETEHGFGCDANRVPLTLGCQSRQGGQAFYTSGKPTSTGWVAGGGIEYAMWDKWSVKAEYTYSDYGTKKINLVDPNYPAKSLRNFETAISAVKFGINYRFN